MEYRYLLAPTIYIHSITDYGYFQDKTSNLTENLLAATVSDGSKSVVVDGLIVDTTYYVAVIARNHSGLTSIVSSNDLLLPGLRFYLSAMSPNGSTILEDRVTSNLLGPNADNAVVQHIRQLNTWNRIDDLVMPYFHINNTLEVTVYSGSLSNDDAYLHLGFYDADDELISELRYRDSGSYTGLIEFENASGVVTTTYPRYGTYSSYFQGELSFTNDQIRFEHGSDTWGIDDFVIDMITEDIYIPISLFIDST